MQVEEHLLGRRTFVDLTKKQKRSITTHDWVGWVGCHNFKFLKNGPSIKSSGISDMDCCTIRELIF